VRNPRASVRDMIISMLVLLVPVVAIYWFFNVEPDEPTVTAVAVAPTLATARTESPFPILAPTNLPDTWKPTRVTWAKPGDALIGGEIATSHVWVLGVLSPDKVYLALETRDTPAATFVKDATREGANDGTSTLGGQVWTRYLSSDARTRSLVLTTDDVTTVISGDTSYSALEAYAGTLSAG